jgi:hypothetical protein
MKADQHSHNLKLAHSWIMVLSTPARQTRPTVHQNLHPNSPNQLFEPISPFQEFTGYRLHHKSSNSNINSNNENKYHQQQQPRRCIAGDQLAALKAKNLFQHAALQDKAVAPLPVERKRSDAPQHRPTHAGGIPLEIVTITDQLPCVPGMIRVSQRDLLQDSDGDGDVDNDDDVNSEVSFEDTALEQQYQLRQLDPFGLNDSNAALFPPLSKHHTQHDATWGITTMRFEGEDNDDDDEDDDDTNGDGIDLDDDDTISDIDWPSDEDKSEDHRRAPPHLMCADATHAFRQNLNCSGLQFWTNGAVHQRNLCTTTTTANANKHTGNTRATVRSLAATRDEENTHERVENSSSRDTVLEVPWASYEDFHFSRNRSYASRGPSRVQLM